MTLSLRKLRTISTRALALLTILIVGFSLGLIPQINQMQTNLQAQVESHLELQITHPGWSFPGTLYSGSAPLSLPIKRKIAHAQLRQKRHCGTPPHPSAHTSTCPLCGSAGVAQGRHPRMQSCPRAGPKARMALSKLMDSWIIFVKIIDLMKIR